MPFIDRVHVEKIAEALWNPTRGERPGAALMVGAGMSRNAVRPSPAEGRLPDWNELTARLIGELHPDAVGEERERAAALRRAGAVSGFLRLAEEYEATHGRGALHQFLLRNVPDESVSPGKLHKSLLKLPWQDVFTTNWDTLLERTAKEEPFLGYTTVTRAEQIPRSAPPRIVKLHGSFPDIEPFIFTEEDFRTYPRKFAPFVNMMRQGLMEHILVLIGFSGDDPNFLQWAGWVRDEIGAAGPQVYLCGWLELREGQRRLLEKLRVVPVDYSKHEEARKGYWDADKYGLALNQFISDLNEGLREDLSVTNSTIDLISDSYINFTVLCQGISGINSYKSFEEYIIKLNNFISNPELIRKTKTKYLVPRKINPDENFLYAQNSFVRPSNIEVIKESLSRLVDLINEFNYNNSNSVSNIKFEKYHFLLNYIFTVYCDANASYIDLGAEFFEQVEELYGAPCSGVTSSLGVASDYPSGRPPVWYGSGNADAAKQLPFHEAKPRLQELWLGCLRRHRIDSYDAAARQERFESWAEALESLDDHDPKVREAVWHQRCIHGLRVFDPDAVDLVLEKWREADNAMIRDPYWAVRQAGILAEIGRSDTAVKLATDAFSAMQRQMQQSTRSALSSRQVWTIVFLLLLTHDEDERTQLKRSLAKISTPEIDPLALLEKWRMEFRPDIRLKRDVYGESTDENIRHEALITAQRFVRFVEKIGFPAFAAQWDHHKKQPFVKDVFAKELMAAGNRMAGDAPGRSLAVCLRACSGGVGVGAVAVLKGDGLRDRPQLAGEWSGRLAKAAPRLLDRVARTLGAEHSHALSRADVALNALSLLVRNLEEAAMDEVLTAALTCHRHPAAAAQTGLYAPLGNLFAALAAAAPPDVRRRWLGEMLGAPLPGPGGVNPYIAGSWPDPFAPFETCEDWPADAADPVRGGRAARALIDRLAEIAELPEEGRRQQMRKTAFRCAAAVRLRVLLKAGWVPADLAAAVEGALTA